MVLREIPARPSDRSSMTNEEIELKEVVVNIKGYIFIVAPCVLKIH
jgi:hypothetical protein